MFFISLFLIIISSYLITSCVCRKDVKNNIGIIILFLISFSQIVFSFEILSLFSQIGKNQFLICNGVFFILSAVLWLFKIRPLYIPDIKEEINKILFVLKRDYLLKIISVCFLIYIVSQFIYVFIFPVSFGDAITYYFSRCTNWIQSGNINHYMTHDIRELIMPVNLDFLYTWIFLFFEKEQGTAVFSFISYLGAIYLIYNFLGELGYCIRRRLWGIFLFSAFPIIAIMAHTPLGDLFIGTLILCSLYLFMVFCKTDDKISLYFSSLSYALAIGTKTTSFGAMPTVFIACILIFLIHKKENLIKNIIIFSAFFFLNVIIFSSYNYILNYVQFGNIVSNDGHILLNQFRGGLKAYFANVFQYFLYIFDMSGIYDMDFYNDFIMKIRDKIYNYFGFEVFYQSPYYLDKYIFSSIYNPLYSALGALGLTAFLPAMICTFRRHNKNTAKNNIMKILAAIFILNILLFAGAMIFTRYNVRYLVTFFVISSPVIACTYIKSNKNSYKILICWFLFWYLVVCNAIESFLYLNSYIKFCINNREVKEKFLTFNKEYENAESIYDYFLDKPNIKIGLISKYNSNEPPNFGIDRLKLKNKKIDKLLIENMKNYNLREYDYIIVSKEKEQISSNILYKVYNSDNYISKCTYKDKNKKMIKLSDGADISQCVHVYCEIPNDYIISNGFEKNKVLILPYYTIYNRKNE